MDVSTDFRDFAFVTAPVVLLACMISVCVLVVDCLSKALETDMDDATVAAMTAAMAKAKASTPVTQADTPTETTATPSQVPTKAYANHPLVKKTIEDLLKQDIGIGYLEYVDGPFVRLSNPKMTNNVLYCDSNGSTVSVASVLSQEKNLTRPRWLNYVYVEHAVGEPSTLLKDYIAQKHALVFS